MRIVTHHDYPPIPDRQFDWSAIDGDTYDADCDEDGFFSDHPVGHGHTEAAAIADLMIKLQEQDQ